MDTTTAAVIFTSGYLDGDDELTKQKGHRSDILYRDNTNHYYEVNFIDINRLKFDFNKNCSNEKFFFTDIGLIIVPEVTKEYILNAVRELVSEGFFSQQKALNISPADAWTVIELK